MPVPDLSQVQAAIAAEFPVQALPPSADAPLGQLAVVLDKDAQGRDRVIYLTLQPGLDDLYLLQCVCLFPFDAPAERIGDLCRLVAHLNARLPVAGFGLRESEPLLFYRYTLLCPSDQELDARAVLGAVWMAYYGVDYLGSIVEGVATGTIPLVEAMVAGAQMIEQRSGS